MTTLPAELRREIQAKEGRVELRDPDSGEEFVLVRKEWPDRVQAFLKPLEDAWSGPGMQDYDDAPKS